VCGGVGWDCGFCVCHAVVEQHVHTTQGAYLGSYMFVLPRADALCSCVGQSGLAAHQQLCMPLQGSCVWSAGDSQA
jgi:hypothetical protein